MTIRELRHIAIKIKGDAYYEELRLLNDDIEFFSSYIRRNKKSNFGFVLIPCQQSTYEVFKDILESCGELLSHDIEDSYAIYTVMRSIINDLQNETGIYTPDEIRHLSEFLKHDYDLKVEDYVQCFVGCSRGVISVKQRLYEICDYSENGGAGG